ncbi:hypothetical protein [Virgisporangium aurantiacum]|uniref:Uncharacterized protein n=1 Tax=Virgisporangium aurantiacum TaxID=175570 RepID=A0A8J3YWK0_9ACTN|nr:hypothetical protein [Virgisporangium aurantiacum]GIJ53239.1 hypothetical protein Vau01_007550 [Virgisporangium aurantiacum]
MVGMEIDTTLVDLRDVSLDQVRRDFDVLQPAVEVLLQQVERPRFNIGSTSPPGRAD